MLFFVNDSFLIRAAKNEKRKPTMIALLIFIAALNVQSSINTTASTVNFEIDNFGIKTVKGSFAQLEGEVNFNPNEPAKSSFSACVNAATVNTGNRKRDEHLRADDFFNTDVHPTICFTSTGVSKTPLGWVASGQLSLLNTTKDVLIPFTFSDNAIDGQLTIRRLDYGLGANTGTFTVGDDVRIAVHCALN